MEGGKPVWTNDKGVLVYLSVNEAYRARGVVAKAPGVLQRMLGAGHRCLWTVTLAMTGGRDYAERGSADTQAESKRLVEGAVTRLAWRGMAEARVAPKRQDGAMVGSAAQQDDIPLPPGVTYDDIAKASDMVNESARELRRVMSRPVQEAVGRARARLEETPDGPSSHVGRLDTPESGTMRG